MQRTQALCKSTLHSYLRSQAGEIHKTTTYLSSKEGFTSIGFTYSVVMGVVTALEGLKYLSQTQPLKDSSQMSSGHLVEKDVFQN